MADFSALKTAIQTYIKQNGNEEITGDILQEILLSVVTTLGDTAINGLISDLADEVSARQNADGTLQQNITNEATVRGNADTALGGRIDDEETARASGDTALSNRLGSSITAENTAADQIGAEAEARAAADTALQDLIDGITENIENGYVYAGIATPSSTPASGKVFYLALTAGTYTNFGSTVVSQGINILKYNGSAWSLDAFIGIDDELTSGSNNLPKSGNVLENIIKNGSAFDLSAYNAVDGVPATYADLDAALAALSLLPAVYKQPGMSFRFVLTSDNKYVQYRLMPQTFSTDESDWQGVDDEPTAGSDNLVKSGGVNKFLNNNFAVGKGNALQYVYLYCLKPNCLYKIAFQNKDWDMTDTGTSSGDDVIQIRSYVGSNLTGLLTVTRSATKKDYYTFVTPNAFDYIRIGIRAASNVVVNFSITEHPTNSIQIYTNQGLYIEEDENSNKVFIKVNGSIYSRGVDLNNTSLTLTNTQLIEHLNVSGSTSPSGVDTCISIDSTYSFVFNAVSRKFEIVARDNVTQFMIVLVESVSGKVKRFYNGVSPIFYPDIVKEKRLISAEGRISSQVLVGQGTTRSLVKLYCLQPKQAYTIVFKNKDWDLTGTGTGTGDDIIQIRTYINDTYSASLRVVTRSATKQQSYSFVTPATFDYVRISILAAVGTEVPFDIVPMDVNGVQIYTNQGIYIEEDETNSKVFCKIRSSIYSRAEWSDLYFTFNNTQLLANLGVSGVTSTLGVSDCFELDTTYSFVFDVVNKKFSIVKREDVSPYMIVLVESVSGKVKRFYNGIFDFNRDILDYGFTGIYVKNDVDSKVREYCSLLNTNGVCDTLLFFTDPHLMGVGDMSYLEVLKYKQYIGLLQKYYNSTPADLIICGGDWLNNGDTQEQACRKLGMIDSTMRKLFKNYLPVVGNHDSNNQGVVSSEDSSNGRISNQAMVNLFFREEKKAYYEHISDNTKYIILDTQIGNEGELDVYAWGQIAWLAGRLNENTNEHIIMVQHIYTAPNESTPILFTQKEILLLEAFNSRGTVELNGITYDFTNAQGKVHCIIAGHTHYDSIITSGNIPVWLTTNTQDGGKPTFDMLVIDYGNYKLKSVRVGTGSNREMNLAH